MKSVNVPFYRHPLDGGHAVHIAKVLDSAILTSGNIGREVEAQICEFFETPHALLTNSWTNGCIATLLALEIGAGDEVIVPAMTFVASSNVVELVGARPVFVDVDPGTLLMDPEAVRNAITSATRAVMPVHLYGQMVDMRALGDVLANRPDVAIIEDCAHCFEGSRSGVKPGTLSTAALFSFYATKNVTCGEGGAIIARDLKLGEKLEQTRLHGMSAGAIDRYQKGSYRHWDMFRLGTKANLPDLLAALLPAQISTIRERLAERESQCQRYERAFESTPLRLVESVPEAVSARHLFPIHVSPKIRDEFIAGLNASGVGVTVNFRSVPTLTYYKEKYGYGPDSFPESFEWGSGTISLPMFPGLTEIEQEYVIQTVLRYVNELIDEA